MRSRLVLRRIVPQQLIQRPRQILRLQMQELIRLIPRVQTVQRILRQLMELQGKESPDSDRRGENAHLHQFS